MSDLNILCTDTNVDTACFAGSFESCFSQIWSKPSVKTTFLVTTDKKEIQNQTDFSHWVPVPLKFYAQYCLSVCCRNKIAFWHTFLFTAFGKSDYSRDWLACSQSCHSLGVILFFSYSKQTQKPSGTNEHADELEIVWNLPGALSSMFAWLYALVTSFTDYIKSNNVLYTVLKNTTIV